MAYSSFSESLGFAFDIAEFYHQAIH